MNICPSCGKGVLAPKINSSPFMVIKESVTQNEINSKTVFVQKGVNKYNHEENTTSYYLGREFGIVGLQLVSFSLSCLFMHQLPKGGRSKEGKEVVQGCVEHSVNELVKVAQDKKIILMMGAELVKTFTGYNTSDVYGLLCKSELLPNVPVIIPAPNSDKLMNSPIGEMRLALKVLAEQIKIYKQYSSIGG